MTSDETTRLDEVRARSIRNFSDVDEPVVRHPRYQSLGGSFFEGTAAKKRGAHLSISTNEPVELCECVDSDKHLVFATNCRATARRTGVVDDWDGKA